MKRKISYVLAFVLILTLSLPMTAYAADPTISLDKSSYEVGEVITVTFSGVTAQMITDKAYVSWYKAGAAHSEFNGYAYLASASGTLTFAGKKPNTITLTGTKSYTPDEAGNYEMRLYMKDEVYTAANLAKSVTFTVTAATVAATPAASPKGGAYSAEQTVKLTCATDGATIYYTTNDSAPTASSTKYTEPIKISATTTLKAIAIKAGMANSAVMTEAYVFEAAVATPTALPKGGTYSAEQAVTLTCATTGAAIYYTTNGSTPTAISTKYTTPVSISATTTLVAIAIKAGMANSAVMTEAYVFEAAVATPTALPKGGTYSAEQSVTLTCATTGAAIYYTTNGSTPSALSTKYTAPVKIDVDTKLMAIAVKADMANSAVMTEAYVLSPAVGSMANFKQVNTYKSGQFADVNEDQWFGFNQQKVVARAFEYGLMKGNSDTTFNPTGNVTIAEAITIAARVHSIYTTGKDEFVQGSPWYQVYVDYAVSKGIIKSTDFNNYTNAATRAEMAYIFSQSLPAAEFKEQNTVNSLPDVNSSTPYYSAIFTLYKAGILTGGDAQGTFKPGDNITRAEAAAIISRVILPDTRASGKTY